MKKLVLLVLVMTALLQLRAQTQRASPRNARGLSISSVNRPNGYFTAATAPKKALAANGTDSVYWIQIAVDSGVVHAAVAVPKGKGPFPAIIILHGTHGFAKEYVSLARRMAGKGFVGVAACWFAGRRGEGVRFITPIDCTDAPPLIDAPGMGRFRLARKTVGSLVRNVNALPKVRPSHLALFGHSRGTGAALDYLLANPGSVQALVLNSGGYPPEVIERAAEITAPVLLLHGTADGPADGGSPVTNIVAARQFETALRKTHRKVEVKYYAGSGHNAFFADSTQFADTADRMSAFLRGVLSK